MLKDRKISYDEIVLKTKEDKSPHVRGLIKTRIVDSTNAKQILRLDNREKFSDSDIQRYKNKCYYSNFIDFDAIVVSDYNKGLIDNIIIEKLEKVECPVFVDTKKKDLSIWKNIKKCFVKINSKEYENSHASNEVENLIVTNGENGSAYYQRGLLNSLFKTDEVEGADVVGAGDVYLAAFVVASLEGKEIGDCLKFANKAASISVKSFGTTIVERNDLK
jgi:bifunctional ADP-heptose synthase (sugar kinase/adenylyltransferase)